MSQALETSINDQIEKQFYDSVLKIKSVNTTNSTAEKEEFIKQVNYQADAYQKMVNETYLKCENFLASAFCD